MSKYKVFTLPEFNDDVIKTFSKSEQEQLDNILDELSEKGSLVGKPLSYDFFREKRIQGKRIYFLVYEEIVLVLIIAQSNKKDQQETINKIKERIPDYKKYVYEELI